MTKYLATYEYSGGHDELGGAGALGLYDSADGAIWRAICDFRAEAGVYSDPEDDDSWYRVDVYTYDGEQTDADDAHADMMDACDGEDGDVLHADVCAGVVTLEIYGARLVVRGSIEDGDA